VELFAGGDIKIFGGEPLLAPEGVDFVLQEVCRYPQIRWLYLSTNGLGLNQQWLEKLRKHPKVILTISMDGRPADHRRMRRSLKGVPDAYEHLVQLKSELLTLPRMVVTQTIAPALADQAANNFAHLCSLGFRKFNFLPGYFLPWKETQLQALEENFQQMASWIKSYWRQGKYLYVRNLFVRAPTPFFNTGFVVDADRSIHPSNLGLSASLDHLRAQTQIGDLDVPPSRTQLENKAAQINQLLQQELPARVWDSTLAADQRLSRFCQQLWPAYMRTRRRAG